jgi:hypothetical protein
MRMASVMKHVEWMKEETEKETLECTWELEELPSSPFNIYGPASPAGEMSCSHTQAINIHACHVECFTNSVLPVLRQYYFIHTWPFVLVFEARCIWLCKVGAVQGKGKPRVCVCFYYYCVPARNAKSHLNVTRLEDELFLMSWALCQFEVA